MPRFLFDLSYDDEPWSLGSGLDLASRERARVEALDSAGEIAKPTHA